MKQLIDFIPLILFFASFKAMGIYKATAILLGSTVAVYGGLWIHQKKLDQTQAITLGATLLFGGMTLAFHSDTFIKLKAPMVSYLSALLFLGSSFWGEKTFSERMMGHVFHMEAPQWKRFNLMWVVFFVILGSTNFYIAFHFERWWVTFKVFGSMAMTIIFVVIQTVIFRDHLS